LQPGHYYGIRAVATNSAGHSTYSRSIHVQTTPPGGHEGVKLLGEVEQNEEELDTASKSTNSVEHTVEESNVKANGSTNDDAEVKIAALTKELNELRRQRKEQERQFEEEVKEAEKTRSALNDERDELKTILEEREKAHNELKKHVNELEKQSKAAQR
jgi:DNA repair exonuclease SbcCD ATPase subunit